MGSVNQGLHAAFSLGLALNQGRQRDGPPALRLAAVSTLRHEAAARGAATNGAALAPRKRLVPRVTSLCHGGLDERLKALLTSTLQLSEVGHDAGAVAHRGHSIEVVLAREGAHLVMQLLPVPGLRGQAALRHVLKVTDDGFIHSITCAAGHHGVVARGKRAGGPRVAAVHIRPAQGGHGGARHHGAAAGAEGCAAACAVNGSVNGRC
mmetsp:Transcript_37172/g.82680  ORF Transcript_37172/g.82680 Transcript_37172/m.82680 type:complete len:208 (+) Transcript_37172:192-815(+)